MLADVVPRWRLLVQGGGPHPLPRQSQQSPSCPPSPPTPSLLHASALYTHVHNPPQGHTRIYIYTHTHTHTHTHTGTHCHSLTPPASAHMNLLSPRPSLCPLPALSPHLLIHKVIGIFSLLITPPPTTPGFQFCPLLSPRGLEQTDPQRMLRQYQWGVRPDPEISTPP